MMSPMDAAGEARLTKLRACIHKKFGPRSSNCHTKRALEMADEAPTPIKTPRTKVRQRIAQAAQISSEQLFVQQFGSCAALMREEFDLARPDGPPALSSKIQTSQQTTPSRSSTTSTHNVVPPTIIAPTTFFSIPSRAQSTSSFATSLPAPSTAVSQLTRPAHIRTPRKAAVKRGRAGESSAEKALPSRKPRLGGIPSRSVDYAGTGASTLHPHTATTWSTLETRKPLTFVTNRSDSFQSNVSTTFFSMTSPSKFHFSSSATKLFSQRQTPRR